MRLYRVDYRDRSFEVVKASDIGAALKKAMSLYPVDVKKIEFIEEFTPPSRLDGCVPCDPRGCNRPGTGSLGKVEMAPDGSPSTDDGCQANDKKAPQ
jgi:hypothetical protein